MPKKKKQKRPYDEANKQNDAFVHAFADSFVAPIYRVPRALFSREGIGRYKNKWRLGLDLFALATTLYVLFSIGYMHFLWFGQSYILIAYIAWGIVGLVLLGIIYQVIRNVNYKKRFTSAGHAKINIPFDKALRIIDTTARWYNDENEANRELVTALRIMGFDAEYQFKLPNGRFADARVETILVEGKLSPNTTGEVDGLLGQLADYTNSGYTVNVIIYGQLNNQARTRIENEIHYRYEGRVFLTFLNNPKRQRSSNSF